MFFELGQLFLISFDLYFPVKSDSLFFLYRTAEEIAVLLFLVFWLYKVRNVKAISLMIEKLENTEFYED